MSKERIEDCRVNHDRYVSVMTGVSDHELSKKLNLVHIQMEVAEKIKNTSSLELLEVWRQQIIEARILKAENQIPDQPSEIELAIADIETFVAKIEKRGTLPIDKVQKKLTQVSELNDDNSQLSLF